MVVAQPAHIRISYGHYGAPEAIALNRRPRLAQLERLEQPAVDQWEQAQRDRDRGMKIKTIAEKNHVSPRTVWRKFRDREMLAARATIDRVLGEGTAETTPQPLLNSREGSTTLGLEAKTADTLLWAASLLTQGALDRTSAVEIDQRWLTRDIRAARLAIEAAEALAAGQAEEAPDLVLPFAPDEAAKTAAHELHVKIQPRPRMIEMAGRDALEGANVELVA